jgi:hypothetical protein
MGSIELAARHRNQIVHRCHFYGCYRLFKPASTATERTNRGSIRRLPLAGIMNNSAARPRHEKELRHRKGKLVKPTK